MSSQTLLCIEDSKLCGLLALLISDLGCQVMVCHDLREAEEVLLSKPFLAAVLTFNAQIDPASFLRAARQHSPDTRLLMLASRDDIESMPGLFKIGLDEMLLMPLNAKRSVGVLQKLLQRPSSGGTRLPVALATEERPSAHRPNHVIARSRAGREVVDRMWAAREEPLGVVLRGEPGMEFELFAREYHGMCGGNHSGQMTVMGRHEVSTEGLETLFSLHRLGDEMIGTLYLADADKLPRSQQAELIAFLGEIRRRREKERPMRFVVSFSDAVSVGASAENAFFEEILFFFPTVIDLPPLRDRREDIEIMARQILQSLTAIRMEIKARAFERSAIDWLRSRFWLGNYIEFADVLRRAILACPQRVIDVDTLARATETDVSRRVLPVKALGENASLK